MAAKRIQIIVFWVFMIALSAFGEQTAKPLFIDKTSEYGLEGLGNHKAVWADFNNNGWVDLYSRGIVWFNKEGKAFERVRIGSGDAIAADFNNNGFIDIFSYTHLKLYQNIDGKEFKEFQLPEMPEKHISRAACWADLNGNGYLDIYIGGYEDWQTQTTYPDLILFNEKGKSFKLVKNDTGLRARGVTASDFNNNGNMDIYVSNYRLQPNLLLINDGSGNFTDKAESFNAVATSGKFEGAHSISAVWADFDNDSFLDLFAANFAHRDSRGNQPQSRFLRNAGANRNYEFIDIGTRGVAYQESYAHATAADFDNDGFVDLFITTVYKTASFGKENNPVLYKNHGRWQFRDYTAIAGLQKLPPTYQAAWADINNNGNLDLLTAGKLFINQGSGNNWLQIRLVGDGKTVNTSAIGSQVRIKTENGTITRQVEAGSGEGNQNQLALHFGMGKSDEPVDLEINWQGKETQKIKQVQINQIITIKYND